MDGDIAEFVACGFWEVNAPSQVVDCATVPLTQMPFLPLPERTFSLIVVGNAVAEAAEGTTQRAMSRAVVIAAQRPPSSDMGTARADGKTFLPCIRYDWSRVKE
jgi:hypothetical protein